MNESMEPNDELRPEYDMKDLLEHGVRGKYAEEYASGVKMVLLDPDIAAAFPTAEAVNEALRLVVQLAQIPVVKAKQPTAV